LLFPRFRSKERDLKSDIERLSAIGAAIAQAIDETERELSGLILRLDDARSRAAFLYGDVIDGEIENDARSASLVAEAERFLVRGERRQEEIKAHLAVLNDLAARVSASIGALRSGEPG
jgi:hypothetical protein